MQRAKTILLLALAICLTACESKRSGFGNVNLVATSSEQTDIATINFCEIIDHTNDYDGKILRTKAIISASLETQFIYDPACINKNAAVTYDYDNIEVYKYLDEMLEKDRNSKPSTRLNVTIVGRFEVSPKGGFGHLGSFKYRFLIISCERAEAVPSEVPWPSV